MELLQEEHSGLVSSDDPMDEEPMSEGSEIAEEELSSSLITMSFWKLAAASLFLCSAVSMYPTDTFARRRLTSIENSVPSYMQALFEDLKERRKLMEETPPEEVKYWFEYSGPLQVSECLSLALCVVLI